MWVRRQPGERVLGALHTVLTPPALQADVDPAPAAAVAEPAAEEGAAAGTTAEDDDEDLDMAVVGAEAGPDGAWSRATGLVG
jgi:hypothetical protein